MKRITYSVLVGSLALALTALGAPNDNSDRGKGKSRKNRAAAQVAAAPGRGGAIVNSRGRMSANRSITGARFVHRDYARSNARSNAAVNRERAIARSEATDRVRARENVVVTRERNFRTNNEFRNRANVAVNRERDFRTNRIRSAEINRNRNVTIVNNWRGDRFRGQNYAAFRNYHREWHNRDWWHHHCSRVVFISGGWWAWNAGYWYPAWGYDSSYTYYPYDGPIYTGVADLNPDQVIVNVQVQLQRDGYYPGPIDGDLGPMTRRAIAAYQADHGLAITSTIDQPTLSELGVS